MGFEIDDVIHILSRPRDANKPWMTARRLVRRLGLNESFKDSVEEALVAYCKTCGESSRKPLVRYSSLPSKSSLEVLWGHIDFVGDRNLCDIRKTDVADDSLGDFEEFEDPDVFISHSFKDYEDVIEIARLLQKKKVRPWLAETHIQQHEHINTEVISALENTQYFAVFLSKNAFASKWTGKEYHIAKSKNANIIIIADCRDTFVRTLVKRKIQGDSGPWEMPSGNAAYFFESLFADNNAKTRFVVYPESCWIRLGLEDHTESVLRLNDLVSLVKQA